MQHPAARWVFGGRRRMEKQRTQSENLSGAGGADGFGNFRPELCDLFGAQSSELVRSGQHPKRPVFRRTVVEVEAQGEHFL